MLDITKDTASTKSSERTEKNPGVEKNVKDISVTAAVLDSRRRLSSDNKFSCKSVNSADDPVEELGANVTRQQSINNTCHECFSDIQNDRRINEFACSRGLQPPTFSCLKKYGYEERLPGPLVRMNVGGTSFIVKLSTLRKDPMVFEKFLEDAEWLSDTKEYYFDRDPSVFRFVYCYLRYKELHLPQNVCGPLLEKELEAWGIQLGFDLQRCCLGPVVESKSKLESLKKFEAEFTEPFYKHSVCFGKNESWRKIRDDVWHVIGDTPKKRWLAPSTFQITDEAAGETKDEQVNQYFSNTLDTRLTDMPSINQNLSNYQTVSFKFQPELNDDRETGENFETTYDESTKFTPLNLSFIKSQPKLVIYSRIYLYVQTLLTCLLICLMIFGYVPIMREPFGPDLELSFDNETFVPPNHSFLVYRLYFAFDEKENRVTRPLFVLLLLIWICIILLTLDLIIRVIFCPNFWRWFFSIYAVTDILSLTPFYVELCMYKVIDTYPNTTEYAKHMLTQLRALDGVNLLKIFVAFRLFRLLKRHRPARVLLYTIRTSAFNMLMIFELMGLSTIIFGTAIFLLDIRYSSVFNGMWWAFITMATVGYGDIVPSSPAGYLLAVPCVIIGILLTSYTIPILVNDFLLYYSHADQMAWMRRVHSSATMKRNKERHKLIAKRRMSRVRALLKNTVIGSYTISRINGTLKNT